MKLSEALQIVYDLAEQYALDVHHVRISPELEGEYERQKEALATFHDVVLNGDFDD